VSIGRSFYSPDIRKPQRLGDGLQSWCGFYQSIRPTQMGLSLNIGRVFFSVLFFTLRMKLYGFMLCNYLVSVLLMFYFPHLLLQTCHPLLL